MIIQLCGLSGAGKTTLAQSTSKMLLKHGVPVEIIDGDVYRQNLCKDLSFSLKDRQENIRRLGFVASRFSRQGIVCILSAINPYEEIRREIKLAYPGVKTIYIDCLMEELLARDTKGLYRRAFLPDNHPAKLNNLTGVNDTFEIPSTPDLHINTCFETIEESTLTVFNFIMDNLGRSSIYTEPSLQNLTLVACEE
jgi:adenylylsulfate kinase